MYTHIATRRSDINMPSARDFDSVMALAVLFSFDGVTSVAELYTSWRAAHIPRIQAGVFVAGGRGGTIRPVGC